MIRSVHPRLLINQLGSTSVRPKIFINQLCGYISSGLTFIDQFVIFISLTTFSFQIRLITEQFINLSAENNPTTHVMFSKGNFESFSYIVGHFEV